MAAALDGGHSPCASCARDLASWPIPEQLVELVRKYAGRRLPYIGCGQRGRGHGYPELAHGIRKLTYPVCVKVGELGEQIRQQTVRDLHGHRQAAGRAS